MISGAEKELLRDEKTVSECFFECILSLLALVAYGLVCSAFSSCILVPDWWKKGDRESLEQKSTQSVITQQLLFEGGNNQ